MDEAEVASYIEAYKTGQIELCDKSECDALPSSEELEQIWTKMLEEIKSQRNANQWEFDSAKCELLDEWNCEAILYHGEERVILPLYEDALKYISDEHEENDGQTRWHEITDVIDIAPNMQRLTIKSQFWRNGKKETPRIEVVLDHGKPVYQ